MQGAASNVVLDPLFQTISFASSMAGLVFSGQLSWADDQLNKALGYSPRQADIPYEKISATEFEKCSGKSRNGAVSMGIWFGIPTASLCVGFLTPMVTGTWINGAILEELGSKFIAISIPILMVWPISTTG